MEAEQKMNVTVTTDHRFFRTANGEIWTDGINSYGFWKRYLTGFESLRVIARVCDVDAPESGFRLASGPGVDFVALPDYRGPFQYLPRAPAIKRVLQRELIGPGAVILRASSQIANCAAAVLHRHQRPYGIEVVNDPYDVFAPEAVNYRARPLFRWWFTRQLRQQCGNAIGVAYVTEVALQRRYPTGRFSIAVSDAEIPHAAIVDAPRKSPCPTSSSEPFRLITVASLAQMYKAPDILIRAVAECIRTGLDLTLEIVGDGRHRPELEELAARLRLADRVHFAGKLPAGEEVRRHLDAAHLFVLPSRCEGLPRAMIEAMARALPCIGSAVGGIPELLAPEDLFQPGSVAPLVDKIREVLSSPARMSAMSARSLARAADFREDRLEARRRAFFEQIRVATAERQRKSQTAATVTEPEPQQC
jgi:glycosyltransferase involved in cell wall biosynthesis